MSDEVLNEGVASDAVDTSHEGNLGIGVTGCHSSKLSVGNNVGMLGTGRSTSGLMSQAATPRTGGLEP